MDTMLSFSEVRHFAGQTIRFYAERRAVLLFVFLSVFFTAPGQTIVLGFLTGEMRERLDADRFTYAVYYAVATVTAALFLNPIGRIIDRVPVGRMVIFNSLVLAAGCFLLSGTTSLIFIFIAFFLLRLFGQGVFSLTAGTLLSRVFEKNRGKAGGIMALGFPASELIYPPLLLFIMSSYDWQTGYRIFGAVTIVLFIPAALLCLRYANLPAAGKFYPGEEREVHELNPNARHYTLGECLRDVRFHLLIIASCVPPMVITGFFFEPRYLFAVRGWDMEVAALALVFYAVLKVIGQFFGGPVIDRIGPIRPYTFLILLLAMAPLSLAAGTWQPGTEFWAYIYMGCAGLALGLSSPVSSVIWPELYGTEHIGSIRGFVGLFRNGMTAVGPIVLSLLIDSRPLADPLDDWLLGFAAGIALIAVIPVMVRRLSSPGHLR